MNVHIDPREFTEVIEQAVSEALRRLHAERQTDEQRREALDRDGLAKAYAVSSSTIDRWKKREGLPYVKLANGKPLFLLDSVRQWMKSRETVTTSDEEGGAE